MCSCHEYGKRFSTNGVYYGRESKPAFRRYVKPEVQRNMVKMPMVPNKKFGKS